jgi:Cys-rich protein (TIGR01571 family)
MYADTILILPGCLGYWCPCMLYSRTYHRLKTSPNSNLENFKSCNTQCGLFCFLAPVACTSSPFLAPSNECRIADIIFLVVLTTLQRDRIRDKYQLEGSIASDCAKAFCCSCCVLIQDDREVNHREKDKRRFEGPGSGVVGDQGYRRQPTMTYP